MDREPTDTQRIRIILENMRSDFRAVIEKVCKIPTEKMKNDSMNLKKRSEKNFLF